MTENMKSKILTVFCAGILALSGGMQSAKAQTSSWFNDKDLNIDRGLLLSRTLG